MYWKGTRKSHQTPPIRYSKLEELKQYTIGQVAGYAYTPEFDKAYYLQKKPEKTTISMLKSLPAIVLTW